MNILVSTWILNFFSGLIGAVIGAAATLIATNRANENQRQVAHDQYEREKQEREEQRKALRASIRALLRNEIERNRSILKDYGEYLDTPEAGDGQLSMHTRATRLLSKPLLTWRHSMWDGQAQYLGTVLSPIEIVEAADFYAALDSISDQWAEFHRLGDKLASQVSKLQPDQIANPSRDDVARLGEQLTAVREQYERDIVQPIAAIKDAIFTLYHSKGNPIGPDD